MQFGTGAEIKKIDIDEDFIHVEFEGGGHTTISGSEFRLIARAVEARGAGNIQKLNGLEEGTYKMLAEVLLEERNELRKKFRSQSILIGEKSLEISQLKKQIEKLMTGVDVEA